MSISDSEPAAEAHRGPATDLRERLERRLSTCLGARVGVHELRRLSGGASRESWSFVADVAGRTRRLLLRRDPPGSSRSDGMAREASAIRAAGAVGVPVPGLVDASDDPARLGSPYLIVDFVDGETRPQRLLRETRFASAREGLAGELGRVLARIHTIDPSVLPEPARPTLAPDLVLPNGSEPGASGTDHTDPVAVLRSEHDALGEASPALEMALRWLEDNRPSAVTPTLVHGDFRNGNLIIDEGGLRAVLDWELVHRGDPREDLGWLCVRCWRFGSPETAGGFGSLPELLDGYADVAGWRPDEAAVRWWQVYGTARWAIGCRTMANWHLSGATRSVELAAIGRRAAEQEFDLMMELGHDISACVASAAALTRARLEPTVFGRPTSTELIDAVIGFLREEMQPAIDGRPAFLARVAANVLSCVAREIGAGASLTAELASRLAPLGCSDQDELARALRTGALDPRRPEAVDAVGFVVAARLQTWNPAYSTLAVRTEPPGLRAI